MNYGKNISKESQIALLDALYYMKINELKNACKMLSLPYNFKKTYLIELIIHFIKTGNIISYPTIPNKSRSHNYPSQPLALEGLILYGSYKNNLKTRNFFKEKIGPHFNFTVFGIDWINDRWLNGNPPTYQEFINYWISENEARKIVKFKPKKEWQFINFSQEMKNSNKFISKNDLLISWKTIQASKAKFALEILKKIAFQ